MSLSRSLLEGTVNLFDLYHRTPPGRGGDPRRGVPAWAASQLGSYWTEPVDVPLHCLEDVDAAAISDDRAADVASARINKIELPPIEIAVRKSGDTYLVDGNHRLEDARESGADSINVMFTFPDLA